MRKLWVISLFSFVSCESLYQLEFQADLPKEDEIIISGQIHQRDEFYEVGIFAVNKGWDRGKAIPKAKVCVTDDQGSSWSFLFSPEEGKYISIESGFGQPGSSYQLSVVLPDGRAYESIFERMPVQTMESFELSWREDVRYETSDQGIDVANPGIYLSLEADFSAAPEEPYYIYYLGEELYQFLQKATFCIGCPPPPCYVYRNLDAEEVILVDAKEYKPGSQLNYQDFIFREIDDTFLRKHLLTIYQQSISEAYRQYLSQIRTLVESSGSIFDRPPGFAVGNITALHDKEERVHGYFSAALSERKTIAIWPDDISVRPRDRCNIYREPRCYGCNNNGSFVRPAFYDQVN